MNYKTQGRLAGIVFKLLNLLVGGNLPPFGAVAAVVRRDDTFLLLSRSDGRGLSLPGGVMRWKETAQEAAVREVWEETGYDIRVGSLVNVYSSNTDERFHALMAVYEGEVIGGNARASFEGAPGWWRLEDIASKCSEGTELILQDYLRGLRIGR